MAKNPPAQRTSAQNPEVLGFTLSERLAHFLSTGFYSGLSPKAPGTAGSALACGIAVALSQFRPELFTLYSLLAIAILVSLIGVLAIRTSLKSRRYSSLEEHADPQEIVIDEFAGYAVSILGLGPNPWHLVIAFVAFRIFDISKPPPVSTLEKLPGAWGIMSDDIAAGVLACALSHGLILLFSW